MQLKDPFLNSRCCHANCIFSAHVRVVQTTPKGQSTKASDDKGMHPYMYHSYFIIITLGKNFVALILDSPRGTDKCKRKLQFSEDDDVTKQQKPRKKKRRLLKVS